jgi:beta-lactamase class A
VRRSARAALGGTQRRRTRHDTGGGIRQWLTLAVLLLVVGVASVGPGTIVEAIRGMTYVRPTSVTTPEATLRPDAALQARLDVAAAGLTRGSVSASIIDLGTGAQAEIASDRAVQAASLFKLPILAEVLARIDAGRLDPNAELEVRPEDWTDGSGILQARIGDRLTVRELMRLMIQDSDNIAALVLLDNVGIDTVNATATRMGLRQTHIVDHRQGEPGEHTTSAADMALLLRDISAGQLVDAGVSESALQLLELHQANAWLGDDLPWWVKVAHKWGDLPDARHDAGIVFTPRGNYVVVVLTEDAPPDEAQAVIARISRAAYEYLGQR